MMGQMQEYKDLAPSVKWGNSEKPSSFRVPYGVSTTIQLLPLFNPVPFSPQTLIQKALSNKFLSAPLHFKVCFPGEPNLWQQVLLASSTKHFLKKQIALVLPILYNYTDKKQFLNHFMKLANLRIKIWEYETGILQAKFTCDQRCKDPTENICKAIQQYIKTFDDQSWIYLIKYKIS